MADTIPGNTSTTTSLTLPDGNFFSTIDALGDRDWYSVFLNAGQAYQIWLEGAASGEGTLGDPYLRVYNASGVQVAYNDDAAYGWGDSYLYFAPTTSGMYYFGAGAWNDAGTGTYRITVLQDSLASTASTSTVAVNGYTTGWVGDSAEDTADWIRVNLVAGSFYQFDLMGAAAEWDVGVSDLTLADPWLNLRDASGNLLDYDDDSGIDNNSRLFFQATTTGTYFLDAQSATGGAGSWRLVVNSTPVDAQLAVGGSASGSLTFAGDVDAYSINLTAGVTYSFTLTGNTLTDPVLELLDDYGSVLRYNDDASGLNSFISYTPVSTGTYYLEARGAFNGTGSYTLTAAIPTSGDDYADNANTTGLLTPGGSRSGSIETASDRDWFGIDLVAGQSYTFRLQAGTSSSLDSVLTLYSSAGAQLAYNDDYGYSLDSQLSYTATSSGRYYLEARGYGYGYGAYTISASAGQAADTTAPTVLSFSPSDEATGVAVGTNVQLNFSEAIARGTGTITLKTAAGAIIESFDAASSSRITISGSTLTIDPTSDLSNSAGYRVEFGYGTVRDLAGNNYAGTSSYNFTTAAAASDDYAGNASTTGLVTVNGSKSGTIEIAGDRDWFGVDLVAGQTYTFRLQGSLDTVLTLYSGAGNYLAYNDDYGYSLSSQLSYTATSTGRYYLEARAYGSGYGGYTISASSGAAADTTAPIVLSFSPSDEATGVAVDANIQLTFNESIARGAGTIYLKNAAGTIIESFDAAGSSRLSISGSTLTIDPSSNLAGATGYRVEFAAGTVRDLAGNNYGGTSSYNFTTGGAAGDDYADNTGTTGRLSPGGSASGTIETAGDCDWFAISLSAGQTYTFRLNGTSLSDPFLALYGAAGNLLTYNDDGGGNLNSLITYTASSSGTYFLEASAYSWQTGSYQVSASGIDSTAPTVISFSPADEAASVALGSNITLTFSEAIQRGAGTITLKTGAGAIVESFDAATSGRVAISGSTLTIDPTAALSSGTSYRVEFAAGTVRDLAGNNYAGTSSYNFTTSAASAGDDYAADSGTTGLVAIGGNSSGHIETSGDRDWFRVQLAAGQTYTFNLNAAATNGLWDPYLTLYNSAGSTLAYNDDGGGNFNSSLTYTATASGTYYLEARDWGSNVGDYVLSAGGSADTTAPTVLSFSPADEATGVSTGASIMLTFSELIQRGTGTIQLVTVGGSVIETFQAATSPRVLISGNTVVVDPTVSLANGTTYRVIFEPGSVCDVAGNAYAGTSSYNFTTAGDYTAPVVISFSPADETTAVAVSTDVVLGFSEAIMRGSGFIYLKNGATGAVVESFDAASSSRISISGSTLTLNPTADLAAGVSYRVEFQPGTVRDLAGNSYAGTTSYNFTTATTAGDDYAGNAATMGMLSAGGSKAGHIETVGDRDWFAIGLTAGQAYTFRLDATATSGLQDPYLTLYNSAGSVVTSNDDGGGNLNSLINYTATTSGTYYLEARAWGSGVGDYVVSATGTAAGDVTAPTVVSFNPADDATAVLAGANVTLSFSEAITRGTGTIYLTDSTGSVVESFDAATSSRISVVGYQLVIDPTANFSNGTTYSVQIPWGAVRDLAGNAYAGTTSYNFTAVGDTVAPTVVSFSPADEATSVAVGSNILVTFSEAVQRGSGTIYLKNAAGSVIEAFDAASSGRVGISGSTLTIDPTADLAYGTGYRVEFAAGTVRDLSGNGYAGTTSYNFGTASATSGDDYAANAATSGSVSVGSSASGRIETAGDRDWFAVSLTAGQTYTFRLNGAASNGLSDPYLTLYNSAGSTMASNDDGGDNGLNSRINYTATSSGTYYLEARAYGAEVGSYTVSATASTATGGGSSGGGGSGSGSGTSGFSITVNFQGDTQYQSYFTAAAQRWAQVIVGDLPDVQTTQGLIDDLLISASVVSIDGAGGILGQAGATAFRSGSNLPYAGQMQFDAADVAAMVANGTFGSVVLHEMGHVLGLAGYMWQNEGLVSASNPYVYIGPNAVQAYDSLTAATVTSVPLETNGGSGTAGSHWSEAVFDKELMTGYAEPSPPMPLSVITIGALADLGYTVNYSAADPYSL